MVKEDVNVRLTPGIRQVVIFDDYLKPVSADLEKHASTAQGEIKYLARTSGQRSIAIYWRSHTIALTDDVQSGS